jgi:hypothetical protein
MPNPVTDPALLAELNGGPKAVTDPALLAQLEAPMSGADIAKDVAASSGIGLVKGGIGLAGLPGDVRSLASKATDFVGDKLGIKPETVKAFKDSYALASLIRRLRMFRHQVTSAKALKASQALFMSQRLATDKLPRPLANLPHR